MCKVQCNSCEEYGHIPYQSKKQFHNYYKGQNISLQSARKCKKWPQIAALKHMMQLETFCLQTRLLLHLLLLASWLHSPLPPQLLLLQNWFKKWFNPLSLHLVPQVKPIPQPLYGTVILEPEIIWPIHLQILLIILNGNYPVHTADEESVHATAIGDNPNSLPLQHTFVSSLGQLKKTTMPHFLVLILSCKNGKQGRWLGREAINSILSK